MAFRRPSGSAVSPVNPYASAYPPTTQNQQPLMQDDATKRSDPAVHPPPTDQFINDQDANDSAGDDDEDEEKPKSEKKTGRRKIKIEFIQDKSRRHITFSKRKAGPSSFHPLSLPCPPLTFLMAISRHHEKGWFILFHHTLFSHYPLPLFRHTNFPLSQERRSSFSSSRKLAWSTPSPRPNCNLSSRSRKARISSRHASTRLTAPSLIRCPLVPPWAVPPRRQAWVYPHITTMFLVASLLAATRSTKAPTTMRKSSERVPNAVVEHLPPVLVRVMSPPHAGLAAIQLPVAATHLRPRTAQHRHCHLLLPFLHTPKVHTRVTQAHPTLRWASVHHRRPPPLCNSLRHLITNTQAQRNSTTQARMVPQVMSSTLRNRDSWHRPLLLPMVSANPGSPPHPINGHMVEQSRVDTHGGERLSALHYVLYIHFSAYDVSSQSHVQAVFFSGYVGHSSVTILAPPFFSVSVPAF